MLTGSQMSEGPLQNIIDRLTVAWRERAVALKALSFGVVGIINSAIDFSVFSLAYYYFELPIIVANTLAWIVAVSGSYVMNSTITFAAEFGPASGVQPLCGVRAVAGRRIFRQYRHGLVPGRTWPGPSLGRQDRRHCRELRRQLFAVAFHRVSDEKTDPACGRAVMNYDDNLRAERPNFVTHLECAMTGERHEADQVHNLSRAGKPLLVRYDLAGVAKALTKETLARRAPDLWRYRELLPVRRSADIVSLGESVTPIVRMAKLAGKLGWR